MIKQAKELINAFLQEPVKKPGYMSEHNAMREMNTLKVALPRREGNTQLCLDLLKETTRSILFCITNDLYKMACSRAKEMGINTNRIVTKNSKIGKDYKLCFVDVASFMNQKQEESVYTDSNAKYILVG